jgi:hypothetical protein
MLALLQSGVPAIIGAGGSGAMPGLSGGSTDRLLAGGALGLSQISGQQG